MIVLEQIRERLVEAIKTCGLTRTELARRLHVSQQTVSHYVKGDKMPALDTLANLCAILDLDANDILCLDTYKPQKAVTVNNSFNNNTGKIDFKA